MEPNTIESAVIKSTEETLDTWAFVEVMGHSKIAGRLTTRKLGTAVMLQVDVLKPDGSGPAYSRLYSPSSIFSITPVDREYCLRWSKQAVNYDFTPVPYIQAEKTAPHARQLAHSVDDGEDDYDDE